MKTYKLLVYVALFLAVLYGALVTQTFAESATIQNNGAGSSNSVHINDSTNHETNQSNQNNTTNQGSANSNTGGNTSTGGSITTGDSSTNVSVTNSGNTNQGTQGCCTSPTPKPNSPTATPEPPIGGGGSNTPSTGGGSTSGSSNSVGGGQVQGLSATGSISWDQVLRVVGVALVAASSIFLTKRGAKFS